MLETWSLVLAELIVLFSLDFWALVKPLRLLIVAWASCLALANLVSPFKLLIAELIWLIACWIEFLSNSGFWVLSLIASAFAM